MLATLQPWQKTLLEAAEIIKSVGHCKDEAYGQGGQHCIMAAIYKANDDLGVSWNALLQVARHIGIPTRTLVTWNDAPERTAAEVIAALQEAALT